MRATDRGFDVVVRDDEGRTETMVTVTPIDGNVAQATEIAELVRDEYQTTEDVFDVEETDDTEDLEELVDGHERGVVAIIQEGIDQHRGDVYDANDPTTKDDLDAAADLAKAVEEAATGGDNA